MGKKSILILTSVFIIFIFLISSNWERLYFGYQVDHIVDHFEVNDEIDNRITFINIGNGDRPYIRNLLDTLGKLNPKLVFLDAFFLTHKDSATDHSLAHSIKNVPTVLGIKGFGTNQFKKSIEPISSSAISSGSTLSTSKFGMISTYVPFQNARNLDSTYISHVSIKIVEKIDSLSLKWFVNQVIPGGEYFIDFRYDLNNFRKYDYNDFNFELNDIQNKIVFLAYLGPGREDFFRTLRGVKHKEKYEPQYGDMYGAVVIANEVLSILDRRQPVAY